MTPRASLSYVNIGKTLEIFLPDTTTHSTLIFPIYRRAQSNYAPVPKVASSCGSHVFKKAYVGKHEKSSCPKLLGPEP